MLSDQPIIARSASKLNIFLEVLGKRPDGYHELETVMLRTNLSDTMRFAPREDGKLSLSLASSHQCIDSQAFPVDGSNLILQAASALRELTGCSMGAHIDIVKNIPMKAGLGGASGNAATTLVALNNLWRLNLDQPVLHEVASKLGSDINFFLSGHRAALCTGRGESVTPIPIGGMLSFVALIPETGNSTADVFRKVRLQGDTKSSSGIISEISGGNVRRISMKSFNRLTTAAMRVNPHMADLILHSRRWPHGPVVMSGSGSTCFVLVSNSREAGRIGRNIESHFPVQIRRLRV